MTAPLDSSRLIELVDQRFEETVIPSLSEYTAIPCLSPAFAEDWEQTGELLAAATLLHRWSESRGVAGLRAELLTTTGRTPILFLEVPANDGSTAKGCVLIYGHMDKQPPQGEWRDGLDPFRAVREGDRLYGRGTGDDGYSTFAAVCALEALDALGATHGRVVVLIEASEESGSPDLDHWLVELLPRIGRPDLVVCLDSGCLTYDRLWLTTSLRGLLMATIKVAVLHNGIHSGASGGGVPSSFRILRQLLSRIEDEETGEILLDELRAPVPEAHRSALSAVATEFPESVAADFPVTDGLVLSGRSDADRLIGRAWSSALSVTGMDGIPSVRDAGNVLRPFTTARLSVRLPPTVDADRARSALVTTLESDPPQGATVTVEAESAPGWVADDLEDWLRVAVDASSVASFGLPAGYYGEGGSIPFLATLGQRFPGVPLIATGVLGPESNAHGPNEFLNITMGKAVTAAVANLIAAVAEHST